ncbi:calcium-binding protein [Hansschlegelia zhihuaiae]|uniref:Calcium-binding protein n=1 Tax=Hansschlegelia zhihuaiae TaxID=405005 RepID=A0A4Q0MMF5_9HYPH|nr:calcium-binding protein [Hansschlegelia zhihuaiae]RXF74763.1 calcium-binding protein [Hansschlegelia zhihuaiae]
MVATIDIFEGSDVTTSYQTIYVNVILFGSIIERGDGEITLGLVARPDIGFVPSEDQKQMKIVLRGEGVTFNGEGDVTGGTVKSVDFINKLGLVAQLTGYPMDAQELYEAFQKALEFDFTPVYDILYNRVPYVVNGSRFGDVFGAAALGDTFFGNGGDDVLSGALGDDLIHGGKDDDRLAGGEDDDKVFGEDGNDLARGDAGQDLVDGGAGDDVLTFSAGRDTLKGGTGNDFLNLEEAPSAEPITVDLGKSQIKIGADVSKISSIEGLVGGSTNGGDRYIGDGKDNFFAPQGFDQEIDGKGGHDRLIFYRHDSFFGFATRDTSVTLDASKGVAGVFFEAEAIRFRNIESFAGSHGADTLIGSERDEEFLPLQGWDSVDGGGGIDTLSYELDLVVPDSSATKQGVTVDLAKNKATGTSGETDTIRNFENVTGSTLGDDLSGDKRANELLGLDGADSLTGGNGNDTLDGGLGADGLTGEGGRDVFGFSTALGAGNVDQIVKFSVKDDTIELDRSVFKGLKTGGLDADAFVIAKAAKDDEDRVIYDARSGALLFDADGKGGDDAVKFAELDRNLALTEKDFVVV